MPASPPDKPAPSFFAELRTVITRGRQVVRLVSAQRRRMFKLASLLMIVGAAAATSGVMWLGGLVDAMEGKRSSDFYSRAPLYFFGLSEAFSWVETAPKAADAPAATAPAAAAPAVHLDGALLTKISLAFLASIAVAYLIREGVQVARRMLILNTCTRIEKETTVSLVHHLLRVDLTRLSADRVGALQGRIHRSVEGFIKFLKLTYIDLTPALTTAAFALTGAAVKQPYIALLMAGVIPVSLFITIRQVMSQKGIRTELLRKREGLDGTVVEQLGGIEYIRAANTLPIELARVERVAEDRRGMEIRHHVAMTLFESGKALNEGFFYIVMIAASIYMAVRGDITVGSIVAFSGLYMGVMAPLREVHRILDDAHESSIRVGDLMQMMEEPLDDSYQVRTLRPPRMGGEIPLVAADRLRMEYRTIDGRVFRALDDVSLVIKRGEIIGAAGPSGSGKSTWIKIVLRLIHPAAGTVVLGGEPIQAISREDIGRLIGYVSQVPFVFSGTIYENIAYGNGDVTSDQIEKAARQAAIHDEILAMPGGYQTPLSERGQNLSGGQRQRIALARVLLRNPPILILDEATSALDNISERKIQQSLRETSQDRTMIIVAHRLSTLRDADRILVFENGHIAESGRYEDLMNLNGVFTRLVKSAEGDA